MTREHLRFLAGLVALVLSLACGGAALFVVVSGRSFDGAVPALAWVGTVSATLFTYSGLHGKIDAVHRQVNGNLEREVHRADTAWATVAEVAKTTTTPTVTQDIPQDVDTARHRKD